MLTLSINIQSYLSAICLSSTTPCFHPNGIFYNYILWYFITCVLMYGNVGTALVYIVLLFQNLTLL